MSKNFKNVQKLVNSGSAANLSLQSAQNKANALATSATQACLQIEGL